MFKKRRAAPDERGRVSETINDGLNIPVHTPINIDLLESMLTEHPDRVFKEYLINGLRYGFHTGIQKLPENSIICKNLRSAMSQPEIVTELINTEVLKGYLTGPFTVIPFKHYRINPIGIAEGKYSGKKRLIVDLSAPHDDCCNPSLNDLIDKDQFSLHYVTVDHAIKVIKELGSSSWLIKTDIVDAFKTMPIRPDLWPYHGIHWNEKFYFFKQLVFGSRSSPKIFDTLSQAICWIATNLYNIKHILHLLDDFLVVERPEGNAKDTMKTVLNMFALLGVPLSKKKTIGPSTNLEFLGIHLDSINMEARLPSEKIIRIRDIIDSFKCRSSCTKRELLSLLGHLNFACRIILPGRSFVSRLITLSTTVKKLHHHVHLNSECRADLAMWSLFLSSWNGVSFFIDDFVTEAVDMQLFTDSTRTAFGGYFAGKWFQGQFPSKLLDEQTSMALFELYPIVMACMLWGHMWHRKRIMLNCDNMAVVDIIHKGRSKIPSIMKLMRRLTYHAAVNHFVIMSKFIDTRSNNIADALSRYQMQRFHRLAPHAEAEPTPCLDITLLMMD